MIRQLHPVATGSRPTRTPSSQRGQLLRDVSKGSSPAPLSPPSRLSNPQWLATSSDLSSTDEHIDIRTGPTKLLNSILLCARQSPRDLVDLICTQTTAVFSTPPTLSDDPLPRYPHSTIGFLGELFVSEIRCAGSKLLILGRLSNFYPNSFLASLQARIGLVGYVNELKRELAMRILVLMKRRKYLILRMLTRKANSSVGYKD